MNDRTNKQTTADAVDLRHYIKMINRDGAAVSSSPMISITGRSTESSPRRNSVIISTTAWRGNEVRFHRIERRRLRRRMGSDRTLMGRCVPPRLQRRMVNTMTETVLHRIPVTGVMDLLITTNGCIDILGGVDIQFMLTVRWGQA